MKYVPNICMQTQNLFMEINVTIKDQTRPNDHRLCHKFKQPLYIY